MSWGVRWAPQAQKDMRRLEKKDARRVGRAVDRLATEGHGDVLKLKGVDPAEWRLRIGGFRVRFQYHADERVIEILRVLPRGKAYDG